MDTSVIAMRLRKLDSYLRSLRQMQTVSLDEYLRDDNIQTIVERKLQLSIQACMDIGSYLIGQLALTAPDEPQNLFAVLGRGIVPLRVPMYLRRRLTERVLAGRGSVLGLPDCSATHR